MMARSYSFAVVSARIWRIGSPERTTISGKTSSLLSIARFALERAPERLFVAGILGNAEQRGLRVARSRR